MQSRGVVISGGVSLIVGALAFVGVFSYLAANFNYPAVLDGSASEVLPRLRAGGSDMRAMWAIYAVLPLLLIVGAIGTGFALRSSPKAATVAAVFATVGAFAMCLGLMRWPSIHWVLAESYASAGEEAKLSIAATFTGLNVYLGNYIGEFLGEVCLGVFFLLTGLSLRFEHRFPAWLGFAGMSFGVLFLIGAWRNVFAIVQPVADINNYLLPLWMIVLGVVIIRFYTPGDAR